MTLLSCFCYYLCFAFNALQVVIGPTANETTSILYYTIFLVAFLVAAVYIGMAATVDFGNITCETVISKVTKVRI